MFFNIIALYATFYFPIQPSRSLSRRKSIEFLHREEEREVARALQAEMRQDTKALSQTYGILTSADMLESWRQPKIELDHTLRLLDYPEDAVLRERRLQLEAQVRQLDELWREACEYTPTPPPTTPKTVSTKRYDASQNTGMQYIFA